MKNILLIILASVSILVLRGQSQQSATVGKEKLVDIAADVSLTFHPEYHINKDSVEIQGPFVFDVEEFYGAHEDNPEILSCEGRIYYIVNFLDSNPTMKEDYPYMSNVYVWGDTAEPAMVFYPLTGGYGRNFHFVTFEEQKKELQEKKRSCPK